MRQAGCKGVRHWLPRVAGVLRATRKDKSGGASWPSSCQAALSWADQIAQGQQGKHVSEKGGEALGRPGCVGCMETQQGLGPVHVLAGRRPWLEMGTGEGRAGVKQGGVHLGTTGVTGSVLGGRLVRDPALMSRRALRQDRHVPGEEGHEGGDVIGDVGVDIAHQQAEGAHHLGGVHHGLGTVLHAHTQQLHLWSHARHWQHSGEGAQGCEREHTGMQGSPRAGR